MYLDFHTLCLVDFLVYPSTFASKGSSELLLLFDTNSSIRHTLLSGTARVYMRCKGTTKITAWISDALGQLLYLIETK